MKKVFEFLLILIIFYGVYTAFEKVAPVVAKDIRGIWTVLAALVVSALLITLYRFMVRSEVSAGLKSHIKTLQKDLRHKDVVISEKETAIRDAQSFKKDLITEAESHPQPEK